MLNNKLFIGCLVVAAFVSCKKSNSYDIKGEEAVKFYLNSESPGNAPPNSINYGVTNIPNTTTGVGWVNLSHNVPAAVKFPVFATKPVSADVSIGVQIDNSLIDKYNAEHNTNYKPFPGGMISASVLDAHILKGETKSMDSIILNANVAGLNGLTEAAYMAPYKLITVSNAEVGEITNNTSIQVIYVVMNIELRLIKYLAVAADAIGTLQTPRTAWTATFNPTLQTVGNIFDGATNTFSRWPNGTVGTLDVNMQAQKNVTGIRLYTANSVNQSPTQIKVWLSTDGINYTFIGAPLRANLTYASSYNYILFYKAIPAKYIRLELTYSTSTNTQNFRVTEFDVYGN